MKKSIYLFLAGFLLISTQPCHSQIVINELSSANDAVIADEDGDFEDWIELYNPSGAAIPLNKYSFLYEELNKTPVSWTFPNVFIKPQQHLLIFASNKNRKEVIDHWEVPVHANDYWKYFVGFSEPDSNWRKPTFNDGSWTAGQGGIGYGDGDDSTIIPSCASVYMRKTFTLPDTGKISIGLFTGDADDGFVAYLNNVEVARSGVGVSGDHPPYYTRASMEHEAEMYQNGKFSFSFFISGSIMDSALKQGTNAFCIQTHNFGDGSDDLSSIPYFLTGIKDTSITYPVFPADYYLHTNFSFSNTRGFKITLKDSSGNSVDSLALGVKNMQVNNSRGRTPDGGINWCVFLSPTPQDTNNVSPCSGTYAPEPGFSLPAGFYTGAQSLSITVPAGTTVRYTTNGNIPAGTDAIYTGSISIDSTMAIRARAFSTTGTDIPGPTVTRTYFINENIASRVISLCTDSLNLWDSISGIYVKGPKADTVIPYRNANFWMDWQRHAHIEFFDLSDTLGFNQECALAIHGNYSRSFPQKSFRVSVNDDYGDPFINYKLFPDKNITKFRSFNIRNAGFDWNTGHLRDRFMQKMAQNTGIDIMDGEPVVLFLNGQYWGFYEMRERVDEYYLAENHNIDPDNVDLLRLEGDIVEGSNGAFLDMAKYIGLNDMAVQANYDSALKLIDLPNYCDYFIAETYYDNYDWIYYFGGSNNIKFWRTISPPGKWRYILWDVDLGLRPISPDPVWGLGTFYTCEDDHLGHLIASTGKSVHSTLFKSLLKNITFRNYFINRYADLINTIFHPVNFKKKAYQMRDEMLPDMARQLSRWKGHIQVFPPLPAYVGRANDVPSWTAEIDTMVDYTQCRPQYVRDSIQAGFSLVKQVDVTMDVSPAGAGNIALNTISKLDSLPWTGVYFDGVPVAMTAIANAGYAFSHWQSPVLIANPDTHISVAINVTANEPFTAYFMSVNLPQENFSFGVSPNPFSDDFTLNYTLSSVARISVKLYDMVGREVADIFSSDVIIKPGAYANKINLRGYSLASGAYFIKFTAGEFSKMTKLVKTKK